MSLPSSSVPKSHKAAQIYFDAQYFKSPKTDQKLCLTIIQTHSDAREPKRTHFGQKLCLLVIQVRFKKHALVQKHALWPRAVPGGHAGSRARAVTNSSV
eukprot:scaffold13857_cov20-Tisochrysis_lutea.AAC.2